MRIGAFDIHEPLPELNQPHAITMLRPWIDVGNVGTLTISRLEEQFHARDLGKLVRPGNFFDFTRYRPMIYIVQGEKQVVVPNSLVTYAKRETGNDLVFLHLLEPHMLGEVYIDSVLRLLRRLGVKRYTLVGSMYDFVPHSRPLTVTGSGLGKETEAAIIRAGVLTSDYQGPTTIAYLISQRGLQMGFETATIIVHIPQYTQLDEDYIGQVRLMEVLGSLYNFPRNPVDVARAEKQRQEIDSAVQNDPQVKGIVTQLETLYDTREASREDEIIPQLSPQVERFLRELEGRLGQG